MQRDGGTSSDGSITQKNTIFRTLVVEGEVFYAGLLEEFLEAQRHVILRANTAEEALAKTAEYWPDLILLNREMVGTDGLNFLPELLMKHPSAAVIMMGTRPSTSDVVEAMKLGAVDYLDRPLDPKKLKAAIDAQKALYELF